MSAERDLAGIGGEKIEVSEIGIHIKIDQIFTPKDALELTKKITRALFDWHELTGKNIDEDK